MEFENRICNVCKKEYVPITENQRYCSFTCRKKANNMRYKLKNISTTNSTNNTKTKRYTTTNQILYNKLVFQQNEVWIIKDIRSSLYYWKSFINGEQTLESDGYFEDLSKCKTDIKKAFKK